MQISENTVRTLSHHAIKVGRIFPKIITHCYTIRLVYCIITMEDIHYEELNLAFMKQYSDVFFKKLSSKLSSEDGLKYHIILKNDRFINDKFMCVFIRY